MFRNRQTMIAVWAGFAASLTIWPSASAPAAEGKKGGAKIVCRSMAELPRIATPGKAVDFLDERWVEDTHCLTRKLSRAELLPEPVLRHDCINCPLAASGTVLRRDDGTLAFYYQTVPRFKPWGGIPKDAPESVKTKRWSSLYKYFLHYATSKDGVHWDLPNLGLRNSYPVNKNGEIPYVEGDKEMLVEWLDDKDNNIVLSLNEKDRNRRQLTSSAGLAGGFCVIDAKQTPHPAERGRFTAFYGSGGFCLAYSDDGLQWTAYPENPIRQGQSSDTYNVLMYDPRREEYVIFCRPRWARGGPDPRAVTRIVSKDLIHWGPERIILQTDDRDAPAHGRRKLRGKTGESVFTRGRELQFYGFTPKVYQDLYIGFALVYDTYSKTSWYELTHSYDGLEWKREPRREPFIAPSPGEWTAGGLGYMATGCPMEIGEHHYFYPTAVNWLHNGRLISVQDQGRLRLIAGARIRRGRFVGYATGVHYPFTRPAKVSKVPPYWQDRGMLMTRPFKLECERIFLNARATDGGTTAVEIRDGLDVAPTSATAKAMKAYDRQNVNLIQSVDAIKIPVTFKNADLKPLRGRMIRLRIHLEKATVYGLSFE